MTTRAHHYKMLYRRRRLALTNSNIVKAVSFILRISLVIDKMPIKLNGFDGTEKDAKMMLFLSFFFSLSLSFGVCVCVFFPFVLKMQFVEHIRNLPAPQLLHSSHSVIHYIRRNRIPCTVSQLNGTHGCGKKTVAFTFNPAYRCE